MPRATLRGAEINYDVVGSQGPWCVMTSGGRYDLEHNRALAESIAAGGYRVVLHDRRNIGASDVGIGPEEYEDELYADDVMALLSSLDALPVFVLGVMAGNRVSFNLVLRQPEAVRALVVLWPSGGQPAAEILAGRYYGQFADLASQGGMQAVCETPYYSERIAQNPRNRDLLLAMNRDEFIATMRRWEKGMLDSAHQPTTGVSEEKLRRIAVPTLIFPGLIDDHIHGNKPSEDVARLIPGAQLHPLAEIRRPPDAVGVTWLFDALHQRVNDLELPSLIVSFLDEVREREG